MRAYGTPRRKTGRYDSSKDRYAFKSKERQRAREIIEQEFRDYEEEEWDELWRFLLRDDWPID